MNSKDNLSQVYKVRFVNPWLQGLLLMLFCIISVLMFRGFYEFGLPPWFLGVLVVISFFASEYLAKGILTVKMDDLKIGFTKRNIPFLKKETTQSIQIPEIWYLDRRSSILYSFFKIVLKDGRKYQICRQSTWKSHKDDFQLVVNTLAERANLPPDKR